MIRAYKQQQRKTDGNTWISRQEDASRSKIYPIIVEGGVAASLNWAKKLVLFRGLLFLCGLWIEHPSNNFFGATNARMPWTCFWQTLEIWALLKWVYWRGSTFWLRPCLVLFANASCSDNVTRARICSSGWLGSNEWQIQWHSTANPKTNFTMLKPRILLLVFGFQRRQSWSSHFPVQCLWLTRHQDILFNLHNLTHIASKLQKNTIGDGGSTAL